MIEVKNIVKKFGNQTVLKGISTRFEAGMTNLIIGQSGSGKTVFLKTLLGIHTPDGGTISFDGRIYSELSNDEKRALRTEIGMVFQGSALFDSMTVEENVGFPLKMFTNNTPKQIKERVDFVIDRVKCCRIPVKACVASGGRTCDRFDGLTSSCHFVMTNTALD